MKKLFLIIISLLILMPNVTFAQEEDSSTATPSGNQIPESKEEIERVQRIKDIVASKVAELNLVERRGIIATITESSNTKIKAVDNKNSNIEIDVDELTNFDFSDEDFGISDLEIGVIYSFVGLYNRDSEKLLARFISQPDSIPDYINGAILKINEDDFQIDVVDSEGKTSTIDIEKSTGTMLIDDSGELKTSGFSNLVVGQKIIVVGFSTDEDTISSTRIIHFTQIPPPVEVIANLKDETSVATGSGNTLEILEIEEKN